MKLNDRAPAGDRRKIFVSLRRGAWTLVEGERAALNAPATKHGPAETGIRRVGYRERSIDEGTCRIGVPLSGGWRPSMCRSKSETFERLDIVQAKQAGGRRRVMSQPSRSFGSPEWPRPRTWPISCSATVRKSM